MVALSVVAGLDRLMLRALAEEVQLLLALLELLLQNEA